MPKRRLGALAVVRREEGVIRRSRNKSNVPAAAGEGPKARHAFEPGSLAPHVPFIPIFFRPSSHTVPLCFCPTHATFTSVLHDACDAPELGVAERCALWDGARCLPCAICSFSPVFGVVCSLHPFDEPGEQRSACNGALFVTVFGNNHPVLRLMTARTRERAVSV